MKSKMRHKIIWSALLVLLITTSCVAARQGVSWPAIDTITINGEQKIVVAYNEHVALVEPSNGALVSLTNAEGEIRRDDEGNVREFVVNGNDYENAQFFASPLRLDEETLLFPAYNERLLQFDLITANADNVAGISLPGQVIAEPAVGNDLWYVPIKTRHVVALDAETNDVVWTAETQEGVWDSPLLVDEVLYFGEVDHIFYAINAETGETLWTQDLEGAIAATPTYYEGRLFVGSFSHKMVEIDSETGDILSEHEGTNWIWSSPVIEDGTLYYTDLSGFVYALDVNNNLQEIWSRQVAERGIRAAPLVVGQDVIVASRDGKVYWLDRESGVIVNEREIDGRPEILSEILLLEPDETLNIAEPIIVVSTTDMGRLLVAFPLDFRSGINGWTYAR